MKIGIFGESISGKSTILGVIAAQSGYSIDSSEGKKGIYVIHVPDGRVNRLADFLQAERKVLATITLSEILPGSEGLITSENSPLLKSLNLIALVVPAFLSDEAGYAPGGKDLDSYVSDLETEICLADYLIAQKRLERIIKEGRKGGREREVIEKVVSHLEVSTPLRNIEFSLAEKREISGFSFISDIPIMVIVNAAEDHIGNKALEGEAEKIRKRGISVHISCALLEEEVMDLEPGERKSYLEEAGVCEMLFGSLLKTSFDILDRITFFTVLSDEVRAWDLRRGSTVREAAGRIHSDMERGFIRAEVINYKDLADIGNMAEAKNEGKVRLEGKDYMVSDGDVITIRFKV